MRAVRIGLNAAGTIDFLTLNTPGDTGRHTVIRRFPKAAGFNWLPAAPYTFHESGRCIVAVEKDHRLARLLATEHGLTREIRALGPGAYMIRRIKGHKGICLLLVGGDRAAFHYALSDVAGHLEWQRNALIYRGGERTEQPVFPVRAYWHNDTRTRWNPDGKYPVTHTCLLDYPESAETFIDNFKRVVDGMVDYRRNMLSPYGFVRDEHGGVEATQEVCRYARAHGIDVVPGVGTHFYGGPYYRGAHPFNLDTYMQRHKRRLRTDKLGLLRPCPTNPRDVAWMLDGIHWLFETFDIQGLTLENGDYFLCDCPRCTRAYRKLGGCKNPAFYNAQALCYRPILKELQRIPQCRWSLYATYTSFSPLHLSGLDPYDPSFTEAQRQKIWSELRAGKRQRFQDMALQEKPAFAGEFPEQAIAQWNVDGQLRRFMPLRLFLDDGRPAEVYEGPLWPASLRSPVKRNVFYSTQSLGGGLCLSVLKELAVRGADGGFEGTVDYGERSPAEVPVDINYLAQSHFAYHPHDSLRQFARVQLANRTGSAALAEEWIEYLCRKDEGSLDDRDRKRIREHQREFENAMIHTNATRGAPADYSVDRFANWTPYTYWKWLGE